MPGDSQFLLGRRQLLATASLQALPLLAGAAAAPARELPAVLRLGLVPYLSTRSMVKVFEPLRKHLETRLQREVGVFTASDLRAFAYRMREGAFDLAFAPVHFMRLAELEWGYRIVAETGAEAKVVIATRRNSPLRNAAELAGRRLVSLDRMAITSMLMLDWLAANGLQPGRDLTVEYWVTVSSTLRALEDDKVAAVVLIESMLADFPADVAAGLRVMQDVATFPPPGYVVARSLGDAAVAQLQAALTGFGEGSPQQGSMAASAIRPTVLAASGRMDRYAQQLRTLLG